MDILFLILTIILLNTVSSWQIRREKKDYSQEVLQEIDDFKNIESKYQTILIVGMALLTFVLLLFKIEFTKTNGLLFYIFFIISFIIMYAILIPKLRYRNIPVEFYKKFIIIKAFRIIMVTAIFSYLYFNDVIH